MSPSIIEVSELHKHFKVSRQRRGLLGLFARETTLVRAVDGISFHVEPGELVGYLGPNGAGKSTTLKMLTGLLVPTGGELTVNGRVPEKKHWLTKV